MIEVKSQYDYAKDMVAAGQEILDNNLTERLRAATVASYFTADPPDKMRLVISGHPIDEVKSMSLVVSIDNAARGWTAVVPFDPGNVDRYELFKPRQYNRSEVYIGGKLQGTGLMYTPEPTIDKTGRYVTLESWSLAADAIDSTMFPPFEMNNITLQKRADALVQPFGIRVIWEGGADKPFKRTSAGKSDKVMGHLLSLAQQRKLLTMSNAEGDIVIHSVAAGSPVATLEEGSVPFKKFKARYDGRKMFGSYTCNSSSPKRSKNATAFDDGVPLSRHTTVTANESDDEDMASAAVREAQRALADSLTTPYPVPTWYSKTNPLTLWDANTIVSVISPTMFLPDGFDFLIRSVEYKYSKEATSAVLGIVPPQIYTGEPLEVW